MLRVDAHFKDKLCNSKPFLLQTFVKNNNLKKNNSELKAHKYILFEKVQLKKKLVSA